MIGLRYAPATIEEMRSIQELFASIIFKPDSCLIQVPRYGVFNNIDNTPHNSVAGILTATMNGDEGRTRGLYWYNYNAC